MTNVYSGSKFLFLSIATYCFISGSIFLADGIRGFRSRKMRVPVAKGKYRSWTDGNMITTLIGRYIHRSEYMMRTYVVTGAEAEDHGLAMIVQSIFMFIMGGIILFLTVSIF